MYHEGILKKKKPLYVRNERVSIAIDSSIEEQGAIIYIIQYTIYTYICKHRTHINIIMSYTACSVEYKN